MSRRFQIAILSDVHYAGPIEQAEGDDYETRIIENRLKRFILTLYRERIWLRYPLRQNGQLDRFLADCPPVDYVIANGDYSCNTSACGLSDAGALESARLCLGKLAAKYGERLRVNLGDHELGKLRLMGTRGGMRLKSLQQAQRVLRIPSFWRLELGRYVIFNCVSSLIALPVFHTDLLPAERAEWERLRALHFAEVRAAFAALQPGQRLIFFSHDPSALPFLARDEVIRAKLPQVERTVIGHLHSEAYFRLSKCLAGLPVLRGFGHSIRRMSTALHEARQWKPFNVLLCPSLAGIDLLKDGGFYTVAIDSDAGAPAQFRFHALPR